MKPLIVGSAVVMAVALAYLVGTQMDEFDEPGQAESLGQAIDQAAENLQRKLDEQTSTK